jgi:hypothetical protein
MPLPGQVEVDLNDRDRSPRQILCESLYVYEKTNATHTPHLEVEELVGQMHHVPHSSLVAQ